MKKKKKKNSEDHLIKYLKIFQKKKVKEILPDFGFILDRRAHGGVIFCPGQKVFEEWKENFLKRFEKLCNELRPYILKNKTRVSDPISREKQVVAKLYYLADEGRMGNVTNFFGIWKSKVSNIIRSVTLENFSLVSI